MKVNDSNRDIKDIISYSLTILAILIPTIIFFISSPEKITPIAYIIFIGLGVLILIISIYVFIASKWKEMNKNISNAQDSIDKIKNSLKYEQDYYNMEKRISIVEELLKRKRGAIDPRIIFWILVAILLYLFLRSVGILP